MTNRKAQSAPIANPIAFPDPAADVPQEKAISFSRQGVSIRLPELFWQRLVLFGIGVCCYAGGYILLDIAMGGFDDDEGDDE